MTPREQDALIEAAAREYNRRRAAGVAQHYAAHERTATYIARIYGLHPREVRIAAQYQRLDAQDAAREAAVNAYSVACPDCGAAPGEYCAIYVEDAGFVPHRARYLLARRETSVQTGIPEATLDRMAVQTW